MLMKTTTAVRTLTTVVTALCMALPMLMPAAQAEPRSADAPVETAVEPAPVEAPGVEPACVESASAETPVETSEILQIGHDDIGQGDLRSETLAAAIRLVGLKKSFNPDSFIAHILFVTGLVDKDIFPSRSWSTGLTRAMKNAGLIRTRGKPSPGDLLFFSLSPAAPHSSRAGRVTVGIVEKVRGSRVDFIIAGSERIIRGTLKMGKGRVSETRLTSCTQTTGRRSGHTARGSRGSRHSSSSRSRGSTRNVPCKASDILIGFVDVDAAALALNPLPPVRPDQPAASARPSGDHS